VNTLSNEPYCHSLLQTIGIQVALHGQDLEHNVAEYFRKWQQSNSGCKGPNSDVRHRCYITTSGHNQTKEQMCIILLGHFYMAYSCWCLWTRCRRHYRWT